MGHEVSLPLSSPHASPEAAIEPLVSASAAFTPDLAATAILDAPHIAWISADRDLIVRVVRGNLRLISASAGGVGLPLTQVAPELAGREGDLDALLGGRLDTLDIGLVRREGASEGRHIWAQSTPICDALGNVVGINHMVAQAAQLGDRRERDERRRREITLVRQHVAQLTMELALTRSELQRLDDAKSQFVSAAAHELRNPLASLIGYLELMMTEDLQDLNKAQRTYLAGIDRGAQRLRLLTNNLLDITRIDASQLELDATTMDSLDLVEQAVSEMQPLFDAKKQRLVLKADPALPLIWCDRLRALQILTNLLSNAHKYTPQQGAVTVQVSRVKNKPMVCIQVKDTGIGIPPGDQYRLFTRFYRASNATSADGAGAGLGLAITQSLVRLHGGKLWFESKLGKGTSFYVTFPIAD